MPQSKTHPHKRGKPEKGTARRRRLKEYRRELALLLVAAVLLLGGVWMRTWNNNLAADFAYLPDDSVQLVSKKLQLQLVRTRQALTTLDDEEAQNQVQVVSDAATQARVEQITQELKQRQYKQASSDLAAFSKDIAGWQKELDAKVAAKKHDTQSAVQAPPANALLVPILIYHYTPGDFEKQLRSLIGKGYTAIDFGQLVGAMQHTVKLPKKPVIITFDDGFENQMTAFGLLEKYHMKATFYIIDGGQISNWCIGAGRQYHLPSQPKNGCGDGYLTWDQVRTIDQSGLVTIGAHTINHRALASLSADQQWFEIDQGKLQLEAQLGHSVYDFAYPYGSFNQTTIEQMQKAGFRSAVTTLPGVYQVIGNVYTLHRTRSAYALP